MGGREIRYSEYRIRNTKRTVRRVGGDEYTATARLRVVGRRVGHEAGPYVVRRDGARLRVRTEWGRGAGAGVGRDGAGAAMRPKRTVGRDCM